MAVGGGSGGYRALGTGAWNQIGASYLIPCKGHVVVKEVSASKLNNPFRSGNFLSQNMAGRKAGASDRRGLRLWMIPKTTPIKIDTNAK